jgi:AraC family transcriptional regulator
VRRCVCIEVDLIVFSKRQVMTITVVRQSQHWEPPALSRDDLRLRRVEDLMRANLDKALSLEAMANEACMSRFHFLRMFKQAYGETPFKRLTRLRMDEAQRRLALGRETIQEIAFVCGYENPSHFATAFRRALGVAPKTYRKMKR